MATPIPNLKCFLLDWDGVFNNGAKTISQGSGFSEIDSMGLNLLRYAYFRKNGSIPYTAIITGELNETAKFFAEREKINGLFYKAKNKIIPFNYILETQKLEAEHTCFLFDDVLDLSVARMAGLRILIERAGMPYFSDFVKANNMADFYTQNTGGNNAIREACDHIMFELGNFKEVLNSRIAFDDDYKKYIELRQLQTTEIIDFSNKI